MAAANASLMLPSKAMYVLVLMLAALAAQSRVARSQDCASGLGSLTTCAPFLAGSSSSNPSSDCCAALAGVNHTCLCNTLDIVSRLPSSCRLPAITCPTA